MTVHIFHGRYTRISRKKIAAGVDEGQSRVSDWIYSALEREVKANLVYRLFTGIGAEKVPDAKTLGKIALALGPQVIEQIHQRLVAMAQEKQAVQGKKLRLDTTVVETNMHYPTDSSLLGDWVRVWTRTEE